jgi:hypothetical protein
MKRNPNCGQGKEKKLRARPVFLVCPGFRKSGPSGNRHSESVKKPIARQSKNQYKGPENILLSLEKHECGAEMRLKPPPTIQEPELRILVNEIAKDLRLVFFELEVLPPGVPESFFANPERGGAWPEDIPGKEPTKTEQFYCIVRRPGAWEKYLLTQKGHLRIMTPNGCVRFCKEIGVRKMELFVTNPIEWPEDWLQPRKRTPEEEHEIEQMRGSMEDDEEV